MANNPFSQFDGQQVLRKAFNDSTGNLRTEVDASVLAPNAAIESGGNLAQIQQLLFMILMELKAIRMAEVSLATQGGLAQADDFNPQVNDFDSVSVSS
jgi:hypothetical protein